jgi:peptide/nickel transport system permease protein
MRAFIRRFVRNRPAVLGFAILVIVVLLALLAPVIHPASPFLLIGKPFQPPLGDYAFGTDQLGRDLTAAILYGARTTLLIGFVATLIAVLVGATIGGLAGYYGGRVDAVLMRVTEFFQVLPALLFAMVVVTLFSPTIVTVTIAIGVVSWTGTARLTRGEFLKLKGQDFVRAERAIGARNMRLIWSVILPNALPPLIVSATLAIGAAILFEAGLSFLGLGDPNQMSWGMMIGSSRQYVLSCWWAVAFPGATIFLTVLAVSLIGDGLNDAMNPKLRER